MRPIVSLSIVTVLVLLILQSFFQLALAAMGPGSEAVDFTLPVVDRSGLTGRNLTLSDYRGSVIVLLFFGPWCPPCEQISPFMEELYSQFSPKGTFFVQVAEPWQTQLASDGYQNVTVEQFLTLTRSNITTVLDTPSWIVANDYEVHHFPSVYIILRNFTIETFYYNANSLPNIRSNTAAAIDEALAAPVPEFSMIAVVAVSSLFMSMYILRHRPSLVY